MKYWFKPRDDRRTDRPRTHGRAGRDEHRNRRAPVPDGGTADTPDDAPDDLPKFIPKPGGRVRDREADPGEGELLVLEVLDTRADEHLVEGTDKTVHEYNDGYPPESPVVRAVYTADLDARTEWRPLQELRARADEGELRAYDFPNARLGPLPGGSRRDGEGEQ
jgi:hypothetical protein